MYAQYNEEEFLFNFFKTFDHTQIVVDIGAADGIRYSNSRALIERGWRGLLVEPNKNSFKKLQQLYKNNKDVIIIHAGCSDVTKNDLPFYIDKNDSFEQLSTFSLQQVDKCKHMYNCSFETENINTFNTTELLTQCNIFKVDFLTIDTESFDEKVVKGINFNIIDIKLICIEHVTEQLENYLSSNKYKKIYSTAGNVFFTKQ